MAKNFKEYSKQLNLSDINKEMLKLWDANSLFETSMKEREGCPTFVFFEVPFRQWYARHPSRHGAYY